MKADTLTLKALFQKDVRYVHSDLSATLRVEHRDDQWEPL